VGNKPSPVFVLAAMSCVDAILFISFTVANVMLEVSGGKA